MKTKVVRRDPEMGGFGIPIWCHHHGSKMRIQCFNKNESFVFIKGSAASLRIILVPNGLWLVEWEVENGIFKKVNGSTVFTRDELRAAFGLSDDSGKFGGWLIDQYGADSAQQGVYIRWKDFLNIPCPGTGHDGDPNISIHLDDEIKIAVRQLLE